MSDMTFWSLMFVGWLVANGFTWALCRAAGEADEISESSWPIDR